MNENPYASNSAVGMLQEAAETLKQRAILRDTSDGERSMVRCVEAFNAMYGTELTEEQGWMFMVMLKAARSANGQPHPDDYVDGAAYFSLAGESALK